MISLTSYPGGLTRCALARYWPVARHEPGFNSWLGCVIWNEVTHAHASRLISRAGKRVRWCPV